MYLEILKYYPKFQSKAKENNLAENMHQTLNLCFIFILLLMTSLKKEKYLFKLKELDEQIRYKNNVERLE